MKPFGRPLTPDRPSIMDLLKLCRDRKAFMTSVTGQLRRVLYPVMSFENNLRAQLISSTEGCHHWAPLHLGMMAATSHHWCPACGAIRRVWCGGASEWQVPGQPIKDVL